MKKVAMIFSGVVLLLGCLTLGISLIISSVLPTAFEVYLTANSSSYSGDILHPNMIGLYIFSVVEIVVGAIGLFSLGLKAKD